MKTLGFVALGLVLAACGSDSKAADPLLGVWTYQEATTQCTVGLQLNANMNYAFGEACTLTDGSNGASFEAGTYDVVDNEITLTPTTSSCADFSETVAAYTVSSKQLVLTMADSTLEFQRTKNSGDGAGAVVHGCFAADGTFTPMPLSNAP